jgi:hypothetical protein
MLPIALAAGLAFGAIGLVDSIVASLVVFGSPIAPYAVPSYSLGFVTIIGATLGMTVKGFVGGLIVCVVFNFVARRTGGIELTTESVQTTPP